MSQYKDPFIGDGGGGGRGGRGGRGGGSRNREENEEYMYRRREEGDGLQYSPTSGDTRYGFGAVPITDMDGRSTSRPTQQVRRPQQAMSSRQGGNGQNPPIPPVPRAPSNSSSGNRGPQPRPLRQNYVPSNLDSSEVQEVQQNPNFSYRLNQQPVRSQPKYSQQSEDDRVHLSPTNRPSASSSRSIFIGFDPSNSAAATSSLGVIPNFPPVPPPIPSGSNRKSSGTGPPPSARRGTSSYYSQQALMVSPIPEESSSSDRHGSYASSAAIPTNWNTGPIESYNRDDFLNDSDEYESRILADTDIEERGLVRQASLGRKSRPVITEIRSSERLRNADQGSKSSSSNESFKTGRSVGGSVGVSRTFSRSPAEKSSPTLNPVAGGSGSSLPSIFPGPQAQSPISSSSSGSPIQPPVAFTGDDYMDGGSGFQRRVSQSGSQTFKQESGGSSASNSPWGTDPTSIRKLPPAVGGLAGRRIPPRLNMDAVREAEARGSLTSLPDLIRRATKLAAALGTGRPDSEWGMRGSYMGNSSTSRSNGRSRDTDSISDILASFPPPVLAQGRNRSTRIVSQWPLPGDFTHENDSSIRPSRKQGRRICGLPLWAFILLVILALLVISAGVIVPLQLVNLSKGDSNADDSSPVAQCKEKNPCLNGGENIATKNFCGCVCTNGFTGSDCSQKDDLSCTTVDLKDRKGKKVAGIRNVTMGNALPRLFDIADPFYNIELDMAMILAVFSNESISCTAQNALVTFNGVAIPSASTANNGKRALADAIAALEKRQDLATATSTATSAATTASSSDDDRVPELDPDAVDFARVVVLYLTNFQTLKVAGEAQNAFQSGFTAGRDFGDISLGNNITVDFDNRSIQLSDGDVVGSVNANATTNSTTTSGKTRRSILETYLDELL